MSAVSERICVLCNAEFEAAFDKPGKVNECEDCALEVNRYTGNMIYDHKTGAVLQVNSDPKLTEYINASTKLRNKGSNLGNNLKVDSSMVRSNGLVHTVGDRSRRRE